MDVQKIINQVAYRVEEGYTDFTKSSHINVLKTILWENGLTDEEILKTITAIKTINEGSAEPILQLKKGVEREAGAELEFNYIHSGKKPGQLGEDFEKFIEKYFIQIKNTNTKGTTTFYDLKQGSNYYSLKYSKSIKPSGNQLGKVCGDNFRDFPLKRLINVVKTTGLNNSYGVIAGFVFDTSETTILLRLLYSGIKTGQEILSTINALSDSDVKRYSKALRGGIITSILGYGGSKDFIFPTATYEIIELKNRLKSVLAKHYRTKMDLTKAINNEIDKPL